MCICVSVCVCMSMCAHVYVCVCMYECLCIYECVWLCLEVKCQHRCLSVASTFFETGLPLKQELTDTGGLVSQKVPGPLPPPTPQYLNCKHVSLCCLLCGYWGSNSCPQASMATTLPTKPLQKPHVRAL